MHIVQAHRPRTRLRATPRCTLGRLYRLLKLVTPEARRMLLKQRFSQAQRLALERWILEHRAAYHDEPCEPASQHPKRRPLPSSGCAGVYSRRSGTRLLYAAAGIVGPFRLSTRFVADLGTAIGFRQVISTFSRRVLACGGEAVDEAFARTVAEETLAGTSSRGPWAAMGLRFAVAISARYWVGRQLLTPRYAVPAGTEAGLRAWRRLNEARGLVYRGHTNRYSIIQRHTPSQLEEAWRRLREAHLDVWAEAGKDRSKVAAQIGALEERHQAHRRRLAARWDRACRVIMPTSLSSDSSHGLSTVPTTTTMASTDASVARGDSSIVGCGPPYSATSRAMRKVEAILDCWSNREAARQNAKQRKHVLT